MVYIYNEGKGSFFNMALEEYLFYKRADLRPLLLLWKNRSTIVVGRNQNTINEINSTYVRENGIDVVRRLTGGGAVYHDKGNLNFTYITDVPSGGKVDFTPFIANVVNALEHFGVKAEYTGRNDITIDGKKFSGNAQVRHKNSLMHHGTIMYNSDLSVLSKSLNPSKQKLISKGITSTKSRVCNLSEYLPKGVDLDVFKDRLIVEFNKSSEEDFTKYVLSGEEIAQVEAIAKEKYETWAWNYGKSPSYDISNEKRFDFGTIQIQLLLDDGKIGEMYIFGDFFSKKDMENICKALVGTKYNRESVKKVLTQLDLSSYIDGMTVSKILLVMFV